MRENYNPVSLARYRQLLQAHDWSYEWSDDHRVWLKGRNELAELLILQRDLDPEREVWKEYDQNLKFLHG